MDTYKAQAAHSSYERETLTSSSPPCSHWFPSSADAQSPCHNNTGQLGPPFCGQHSDNKASLYACNHATRTKGNTHLIHLREHPTDVMLSTIPIVRYQSSALKKCLKKKTVVDKWRSQTVRIYMVQVNTRDLAALERLIKKKCYWRGVEIAYAF